MADKFNKGEWSELYAFAKILADRNLVGADQNLNPIPGENYPVLKIVRNSPKIRRTYNLDDDTEVKIFIESDGLFPEQYSITYEELRNVTPQILHSIKNTSGNSFFLPEATSLARKLNAGKIKAKSSKKGDIEIIIHDKITSLPSKVEFSIKSYLGNKPTLLNASKATNFTFRITNFKGELNQINEIDTNSKIQDRVKKIIEQDGIFEFHEVDDKNFRKNLRKIDTKMPAFLAEYLKVFSTGQATKLSELTKIVSCKPMLKVITGYTVEADELKYKISQLLLNIALGMVPKTPWDGFLKADGGYIVVKEDGDIVCFPIYNISQLSEYLFKNTKLQNHSSKRQGFGKLYEVEGQLYFKLNLNIRFS